MNPPLMVELFSGSKRMAEAFRQRGWTVLTIDNDPTLHPHLVADIEDVTPQAIIGRLGGEPDFLWASPPCTAFSVASIGHHWKEGRPSEHAIHGAKLFAETIRLAMQMRAKNWAFENPRAMARKLPILASLPRRTVSYCRYGENRMKPTDIWTNLDEWRDRGCCKSGDDCHEAAPRGARTGTQGIDGAYLRGALPVDLCEEIADAATRAWRKRQHKGAYR